MCDNGVFNLKRTADPFLIKRKRNPLKTGRFFDKTLIFAQPGWGLFGQKAFKVASDEIKNFLEYRYETGHPLSTKADVNEYDFLIISQENIRKTRFSDVKPLLSLLL